MGKLKNIPLRVFRDYLAYCGLNHIVPKEGMRYGAQKD
jgi:hypothetical protein